MGYKKYISEEFYLNNRTHWKEDNAVTEVSVFPETSITFSNTMTPLTVDILPIENGVTYIVNWNGTKTEHVAQIVDVDGIPCVAIGNYQLLMGTGDTGEPFLVLALPAEYITQIGFGSVIYSLDGSTSATFSISTINDGTVVHHLDPIYIKDMYYTEQVEGLGDFLPETVLDKTQTEITSKIGLVNGNTYTVVWNGVEYECVAQEIVMNKIIMTVVGDIYTATGGGAGTAATGEPFCVAEYPDLIAADAGFYVVAIALGDTTNNTITIKGTTIVENVHTIDSKYMDTSVPVINTTEVGQTVVVKAVDKNGKPTEWETVDITAKIDALSDRVKQDYVVLTDKGNSYEYAVYMKNGTLVSYCLPVGAEIATMPTKTEYIDGDYIDFTGIEVKFIMPDGNTVLASSENYTCTSIPEYVTKGTTEVTIVINDGYREYTATTTMPVTVGDFELADFTYTSSNGIYELNTWKGTLNGEPSNDLVIPDNALIVV